MTNKRLIAKCPESFVETLVGTFGPATWSSNTVQWQSPAGLLVAIFSDLDAITVGGRRASGAITVIQQLLLPSPKHAKAMTYRHNTVPGLGVARVTMEAQSVVHVVSRANFFKGEEGERDALGLHLATAGICHMVASLDYGAGPPVKRLPQHDQGCRWSSKEFNTLSFLLNNMDDRVSVGESTCEVQLKSFGDWLSGVPNNGDPRLVVSGECHHSSFGRGLAVELSLGLGLSLAKGRRLAHDLNDWEVRRVIGPPLFGAWTMDAASQRLVFGSFWPNVSHVPNLLPRIATWSVDRLAMVKDELQRSIAGSKAVSA